MAYNTCLTCGFFSRKKVRSLSNSWHEYNTISLPSSHELAETSRQTNCQSNQGNHMILSQLISYRVNITN